MPIDAAADGALRFERPPVQTRHGGRESAGDGLAAADRAIHVRRRDGTWPRMSAELQDDVRSRLIRLVADAMKPIANFGCPSITRNVASAQEQGDSAAALLRLSFELERLNANRPHLDTL